MTHRRACTLIRAGKGACGWSSPVTILFPCIRIHRRSLLRCWHRAICPVRILHPLLEGPSCSGQPSGNSRLSLIVVSRLFLWNFCCTNRNILEGYEQASKQRLSFQELACSEFWEELNCKRSVLVSSLEEREAM